MDVCGRGETAWCRGQCWRVHTGRELRGGVKGYRNCMEVAGQCCWMHRSEVRKGV